MILQCPLVRRGSLLFLERFSQIGRNLPIVTFSLLIKVDPEAQNLPDMEIGNEKDAVLIFKPHVV